MSTSSRTISSTIRQLAKAAIFAAVLAAPLTAVSAYSGNDGGTIVAPTTKKSGAGFVLMVALQRG